MAIINSIDEAVIKPIRNGKLAVFATDTVMGIGCAIKDAELLKEICELKQRPLTQPMALLVSSIEAVEDLTQFKLNNDCRILASTCWPGALTMLVKVNPKVRHQDELWWDLIAPAGYLGVRCPANTLLLKAIEILGGAIVATSANLHGEPVPNSPADLPNEITSKIPNIWFPNDCHFSGLASTVIKIDEDSFSVLREGIFSAKQLKEILRCAKS